jgi:hypothetical protein
MQPGHLAGDKLSGILDGYQFLCLPLVSSKKTTRHGVVTLTCL